jgi:hypothetical protein
MTSAKVVPFFIPSLDDWNGAMVVRLTDHEAALLAAEENGARLEREKVAAWMIDGGYATGHGESMDGLLRELEWQYKERGARLALDAVWLVVKYADTRADPTSILEEIDAISITEILKGKP